MSVIMGPFAFFGQNSPNLKFSSITMFTRLHPELTWVDLSLRDGLLRPSGSFGQCPCRYGPMMASRDIVRLMPELSWCGLAFPAVRHRQLVIQHAAVTGSIILLFSCRTLNMSQLSALKYQT